MRILMLSKACLVGAYQTKLEAISRFDDVDLTVIVPPVWQDAVAPITLEREHTDGYKLLVDPIRFNGNFHLFYFPTLKKRLIELQPDIVHIDEEPYNFATWLAMRQARTAGAKTLFFSWQNINRRYPPPFRQMEKQVLAGVDYGLMGNRDATAVWQAKGYTGKQAIIPQFGVDEKIYTPPPQRDNGRGFIIGCANRRLVPEKGVDLLLHAAAKLSGIWQIRIAGEGPERPLLETLAHELGIADKVQFDGAIPSSAIPAYLQQLDVLVLPSRTLPNWKEQFGRVLIEAMACETAVVGSDSGEIPHVIGDAGLIFPEDEVDALHTHLLKLMKSDDMRRNLGRKGRRRVLNNYTQSQIAAQTVTVYREIIGNER